ncbi:hypothetical protein D770_05315 [Flammeovirgaceae bacterium 311]|nr:hypothetical protein D770_05315 [Flammeovirgaceae bacterium 311]
MNRVLTLLILLLPVTLFSQEMTKVETDSSVIETKYYKGLNSIREFNELKNKDKTYYREYYYDTKILKQEGVFVDGDFVGISREYSADGDLIRVINHDAGTWSIHGKTEFPFYELQESIKLKGDSLIKEVYSKEFFEKHVVWSIGSSYTYNENESGSWSDVFESKPTKFLLRYDIMLDEGHVYDDMIGFELDSKGNYLPNQYQQINGFEKLPDTSKCSFTLTYDLAIKLAKENGLVETDTSKATGLLKWQGYKKPELFNGHYRFYVIQLYDSKKIAGENKDHYEITDYYNVWSFNPWSSELVEQKKMKQVHSREGYHGHLTGFIELKNK